MNFLVTGVQSACLEKNGSAQFPSLFVRFAIDLCTKTIERRWNRFVGFAQLETSEQANTST